MLRFVSKTPTDARAPLSPAHPPIARSDWLILFTAFEGVPVGLDPVRLQQGLFLFSRCPVVPPRSKYAYKPGMARSATTSMAISIASPANDCSSPCP
jgi:hypothetical protein